MRKILQSLLFCFASLAIGAFALDAYAISTPKNLGNGLDVIYKDFQSSPRGGASQAVGAPYVPNSDAARSAFDAAISDATGRVMVTVNLNGDLSVADAVQRLSGKLQVTAQSSRWRKGIVDGWVRVQDVAAIATMKGVSAVILSLKPITNVGAVTQQGVVKHRVDTIAGTYDGTGITVGALSDSYDRAAAAITHAAGDVLSNDLPGAANTAGNTTDVVLIDDTVVGADEGRAMLQLIHDMAPKAKLGFATAGQSQQQFADNIRSLAGLPGSPRAVVGFNANIIVDDVVFLTEPMFSDGVVTQGVNDVTAAGVHYFSSAGNRPSTNAYAANFNLIAANDNPTAGTNINLTGVPPGVCDGGFHNFRTDGGRDIAQTIVRTAGTGSVANRFVFQWDDPFDKLTVGTQIFSQGADFTGTPASLDFVVPIAALVSTRVTVTADVGSLFDAIVTITDPNGVIVVDAQDTGTDETMFFTPTVAGNYTVTVEAFAGTTGLFTVKAFENSSVGMTTDYNVLLFNAAGALVGGSIVDNFGVNQAVEFLGSLPYGTGNNSLQLVICRTAAPNMQANRLRYVIFDSSSGVVSIPAEYISYQYPVTYGHNSSRDGHGVAAYGAFRPYIPESFTSPGPVINVFDINGDRLPTPELRQQPVIAAMDGGNTTFFVSDSAADVDTFPNFFGTSAAAPNAAAVATLVLQARGGPGSVSVADMKHILINSAIPNDLDPYFSKTAIRTNGGTLTISVDADASNTSAAFPLFILDNRVVNVSYSGLGSIASMTFNMQTGNLTGGNENTVIPGLVFDTRAAAAGGLPFTLGPLNGLTAGQITPTFSNQAPAPSLTGQFSTMQLAFAAGAFTGGKSFAFNVDRDEQTTNSLSAPATAGGNSADHWGQAVSIPGGAIIPGGVTVTGTMTDGTTFSGTFRNKIGTGYSPLSGFGFVDAARAVTVATTTTALTVSKAGNGTGMVTSSPAGIACGATCSFDFPNATVVTLTAAPDPTSFFAGWEDCDAPSGTTCTLNALAQPRTVTASFALKTAPDSPVILASTSGNGQASINFTPPAFDGGSPITVYTATCLPGPIVAQGAASPIVVPLLNGQAYTCTVTATNAIGTSAPSASVAATAAPPSFALTVTKNGTGTGTVTSVPPGIACGVDCTEPYTIGSSITLTASADAGTTFAGWSGCDSTATNTCTVTIGAARTVTATFNLVTADMTPDAFSFTDVTNVQPNTVQTSNTITVAGIDSPTPISVTGGSYSIGCTATFVTTSGMVTNGQTVCVRHTSSASLNTTTTTTLTIGGVSDTFTSTTALALAPDGDYDNDGIPNGVEATEFRNPFVKDNDIFGNARLFAMQMYRDFLGREGDAAGIDFYTTGINGGSPTRGEVIQNFFNSPEFSGLASPVARLYFATFLRTPDYDGLVFQINAARNGTPLAVIANNFTQSPEFNSIYGVVTDSQFVTLLYQNILGRAPSQAENDFYVARLTGGQTRGEVLVSFSESPEYQASTNSKVFVTMMYVGMLRRAPEQAGLDFWVNYINGGNSGLALILGFLNAPEYHNRFLP